MITGIIVYLLIGINYLMIAGTTNTSNKATPNITPDEAAQFAMLFIIGWPIVLLVFTIAYLTGRNNDDQ